MQSNQRRRGANYFTLNPCSLFRRLITNMHPKNYAAVAVLFAVNQAMSGCFSAYSRWWGNEPSTGVKVAAATADVATAPVQLPVLAIHKIKHSSYDAEAARAREEQNNREKEARIAASKLVLAELKSNPALLTDDTFWNRQPANDYGLLWFLQEPNSPRSPTINAYLLKRFPDKSTAILGNGRATHAERTAIAIDRAQPYDTRESAIDALLRDKSFEFGEPWRGMVISEFTLKTSLLFGTRRYTRQELISLSQDPKTPAWIQQTARDNIDRNWFKSE